MDKNNLSIFKPTFNSSFLKAIDLEIHLYSGLYIFPCNRICKNYSRIF